MPEPERPSSLGRGTEYGGASGAGEGLSPARGGRTLAAAKGRARTPRGTRGEPAAGALGRCSLGTGRLGAAKGAPGGDAGSWGAASSDPRPAQFRAGKTIRFVVGDAGEFSGIDFPFGKIGDFDGFAGITSLCGLLGCVRFIIPTVF